MRVTMMGRKREYHMLRLADGIQSRMQLLGTNIQIEYKVKWMMLMPLSKKEYTTLLRKY